MAGARWTFCRMEMGDPALVLDAFDDVAPGSDVAKFFRELGAKLSGEPKLIVDSRYLDHMLWLPLVQEGRAVVLGDERTPGGPIFDSAPRDHLEVYALAGGQVLANGLPVHSWEGPLVRNLFYYLVDHPLVTRDDIFERFWPGITIKEATNVFHVTKRKMTECLGYELTAYSGGFYRPSGDVVIRYDAHEFERRVEQARLGEVEQAVLRLSVITGQHS